MRHILAAGALLAATAVAAAASQTDAVLQAAQDLRRAGCSGHAGITSALLRDPSLDEVARRWATQGGGSRLDVAFEAAGVRTRQSASLAVTRGTPETIAAPMTARLCGELTQADWSRLGWFRTDTGVFIVIAVPSTPPAAAQAREIAATVLRLTNALRARGAVCGSQRFGPAGPLQLDERLTRAAQAQADEMARFQFLAHEGRDGSTPAIRVNRTGYTWQVVGENVAAGPESAEEAATGWEQSPEHCRNLMDPDFTALGLAFAVNPGSTGHSTWWSMVLARPKR